MRQISPKDKALRDYAAGVTVTFDGMALVGWMGGCRYKSDRLLLRTNGQSDGRTFGPISNLIGHHHANCSSKSKHFYIQRWRHRSLVYVKWKLQPLKVAMLFVTNNINQKSHPRSIKPIDVQELDDVKPEGT